MNTINALQDLCFEIVITYLPYELCVKEWTQKSSVLCKTNSSWSLRQI